MQILLSNDHICNVFQMNQMTHSEINICLTAYISIHKNATFLNIIPELHVCIVQKSVKCYCLRYVWKQHKLGIVWN